MNLFQAGGLLFSLGVAITICVVFNLYSYWSMMWCFMSKNNLACRRRVKIITMSASGVATLGMMVYFVWRVKHASSLSSLSSE